MEKEMTVREWFESKKDRTFDSIVRYCEIGNQTWKYVINWLFDKYNNDVHFSNNMPSHIKLSALMFFQYVMDHQGMLLKTSHKDVLDFEGSVTDHPLAPAKDDPYSKVAKATDDLLMAISAKTVSKPIAEIAVITTVVPVIPLITGISSPGPGTRPPIVIQKVVDDDMLLGDEDVFDDPAFDL